MHRVLGAIVGVVVATVGVLAFESMNTLRLGLLHEPEVGLAVVIAVACGFLAARTALRRSVAALIVLAAVSPLIWAAAYVVGRNLGDVPNAVLVGLVAIGWLGTVAVLAVGARRQVDSQHTSLSETLTT